MTGKLAVSMMIEPSVVDSVVFDHFPVMLLNWIDTTELGSIGAIEE